MIRVSVLYPSQESTTFNFDYYLQTHMALVKERLGDLLVRCEADKALANGANPKAAPALHCIGHLYFQSMEDMQKGMGTHGRELMADIPNFTNTQPMVQISEVVEV